MELAGFEFVLWSCEDMSDFSRILEWFLDELEFFDISIGNDGGIDEFLIAFDLCKMEFVFFFKSHDFWSVGIVVENFLF